MSDHSAQTVHAPGLVLTEHELSVPLDHARPDGDQITVFAREVADPEGRDRPFLVFLQGGPGSEAPRPTRLPTSPAGSTGRWRDYRVLMLDQRGTGRSTPDRLAARPDRRAAGRAPDATSGPTRSCADAELFREALGVDRWSVLGQSFGGFCALTTSRSRADGAAGGVLHRWAAAGGPPGRRGLRRDVRHPCSSATGATTRAIPGDRDRVRALHERARRRRAPAARRRAGDLGWFRQVGSGLGMSDGAEQLHYLLELDPDSPAFRHDLGGRAPVRRPEPAVRRPCTRPATPTAARPGGPRSG